MASAAVLDFWNIKFLTFGTIIGWNCIIVPNFVKIAKIWWFFLISQDGWRHHLRFSKFKIFNGRRDQEGRIALACLISSKSLEPQPRYGDFSIFQDGGRPPSWICDACVGTTHPFGGLYHCAKFGWNRCSSFDNMHVFRFHEFGLKKPIHAPKLGVLGFLTP